MSAKVCRTVMSAFGPKRTWTTALHMSAYGVSGHDFLQREFLLMTKADMTFCCAFVAF